MFMIKSGVQDANIFKPRLLSVNDMLQYQIHEVIQITKENAINK